MTDKWEREVPVYLFTGFLEGGKTSFMNESMVEEDFAGGEKNLCIITEEGEVRTAIETYKGISPVLEVIEEKDDFTKEHLTELNDKHRPDKVLIECNGMWMLDTVYMNMPDNWTIVQEMCFTNAATFKIYDTNMRQLSFDKLKYADLVVFNRFSRGDDPMDFHKVVRVANRTNQIVYEYEDGELVVDQFEDPLPYDVESPYIDLANRDYAYWYRDIMEEPEVYRGKKMSYEGVIKTKMEDLAFDFVLGRPLMTCCEADIEFMGMRCINKTRTEPRNNTWARVTGKISLDAKNIPIFEVEDIQRKEVPEDVVATFF